MGRILSVAGRGALGDFGWIVGLKLVFKMIPECSTGIHGGEDACEAPAGGDDRGIDMMLSHIVQRSSQGRFELHSVAFVDIGIRNGEFGRLGRAEFLA